MKVRLALLLLGVVVILSGCLFQNIPRAEFNPTPSSGYPPLFVHFDASASRSPNGPILSYDWDFDDGEESSGVTVDHTFAEKGIYSVTLTVTDSEGEVGTLWRNVQALNRAPVADFTWQPYKPTKDSPARFNASASYDPDGYITEWIWSFGDGTSDTGEYVEHLFEPQPYAPYNVRLTVIDDDGDSHFITRQVQVLGCADCGG